jgi:hypothetical protein
VGFGRQKDILQIAFLATGFRTASKCSKNN